MAEYIEREALLKLSAERYKDFCEKSGRSLALDGAILWLKLAVNQTPAADVVEVVRCKDCKHYDDNSDLPGCVNEFNGLVCSRENDFCSYGERRNDGT